MSANKEQTGKIDLTLLPPEFKDQVAQVMMFGAVKYGRYNYTKGHRMCQDLLAAIERHVRDLQKGEDVASDSKMSHFAHIAANCLMAIHQIELGTIKDDRFTAPKLETPVADRVDEPGDRGGMENLGASGNVPGYTGYYSRDCLCDACEKIRNKQRGN
jgi:hypothetical protein